MEVNLGNSETGAGDIAPKSKDAPAPEIGNSKMVKASANTKAIKIDNSVTDENDEAIKSSNAKNKLKTGVTYSNLSYDMYTKDYVHSWDRMVVKLDAKGNAGMLQAFTSWKHRIYQDLTLISGVHYSHFMYNDNYSIFKYKKVLHYYINREFQYCPSFFLKST